MEKREIPGTPELRQHEKSGFLRGGLVNELAGCGHVLLELSRRAGHLNQCEFHDSLLRQQNLHDLPGYNDEADSRQCFRAAGSSRSNLSPRQNRFAGPVLRVLVFGGRTHA